MTLIPKDRATAPETDLLSGVVHVCTFKDGSRICVVEGSQLLIWRAGASVCLTPERWVALARIEPPSAEMSELRALVTAMRPYVEHFLCADFAELEAKQALLRRLAPIRNGT